MSDRRSLPGWMFSSGDPEDANSRSGLQINPDPPLIHLLPRLKEYLRIVDPGRVDRAMELLVNCQSEDELFNDLQTQYGDLEIVEETENAGHLERSESPRRVPSKRSRDEDDLSDFIVSDSELEEPDPDESVSRKTKISRSRSPVLRVRPGPPPSATPVPTTLPLGPTIVCKYGKACYRKNPVHFQEFAHPWLLDQPGKK
jgi:hypothetical protein